MRVFFSLIAFSFMLATCQGACFGKKLKPKFENGKVVWPTKCVDPYDEKEYPVGSEWINADCLKCQCLKEEMSCCHTYGGVAKIDGCITVINKKTCKLEFYRADNPSKRCGQL